MWIFVGRVLREREGRSMNGVFKGQKEDTAAGAETSRY